MTRFLFVSLLLASSCATTTFAVPVNIADRPGNLERDWAFQIDPSEVGEKEGWAAPEFDDSKWRALKVPGCWEAQGVTDPRPGEQPKPKNGVQWTDYDGVAWYRLRVIVPAEWAGKPLDLILGAVDDADRTFFNGRLVGEVAPGTPGGPLLNRCYEVPADAVRAGQENVIAIRVTDGGGPGGLSGQALSLITKERSAAMAHLPQSDRPMEARFADPPADARILKIVHSLPDAAADQDNQFRVLCAQGFGGVVTNVSFDGYLENEDKWKCFARGLDAAKGLGMSLWLYDEKGYPSGNAGGITMRDHPEWEARGRYFADADTMGGAVSLDVPPGTLVRAAAFHKSGEVLSLADPVDLAASIKDGKLTWQAPEGAWHIMVVTEDRLYEGTHAAVSLCDKLPYINLLMAEPTARFIEVTHGAYAKHLGDDLSKYFVATFTDEPSLMSLFFKKQPWRVVPWSPGFADEFQKRRGYALEPMLPALVCEVDAKAKSVRYDYWLTVSELVSDNYFGQIRDWCRKHNIPSGGHLLLEEGMLMHVPLYGDFFRCIRRLDAPSIDCLTSIPEDVAWYIARMIGSVADLEGRPVTMCEVSDHSQVYRPAGDTRPPRDVSEDEIRGTVNRLVLNGINTITSYYSFRGLMTEQLVRLNEWTGRCCTMLRGGKQVSDIALVNPIQSAWTHFTPGHQMVGDSPAAARRIEHVYQRAARDLYASGRDFTYVDAQALLDAKAEQGSLANNGLAWRVVVLPGVDTLPLEAWKRLAQFRQDGGVVIALGARPANSEKEFPSAEVQALATEIFGDEKGAICINPNTAGGVGVLLPRGSEALLPLVIDSVLERDIRSSVGNSALRATHRTIDGREVYFLINDGRKPWEGLVSFAAAGNGRQWDPATGTATPIEKAQDVPLKLAPFGGMLFTFDTRQLPARKMPGPNIGGIILADLPEAAATVANAGSVTGAIAQCSPLAGRAPAWRTTANVTQPGVDCFLFGSLDYAKPLDLTKVELLSFVTEVPAGQTATQPLLIIVRDTHGVEYMTELDQNLNDVGVRTAYVRLNQLRTVGWSKQPEAGLDLAAINSIRIGWGGHTGLENEAIGFAFSAPQAGTAQQ